MSDIKDWSTTAASNNSASPDGFPEGMPPSGVNNAARELMAAVRRQHEDAEWINLGYTCTYASATTFTISGVDVTAAFSAGRRVKIADSSTLYGVISGSTFASNTTVTVVLDSGSLSASMTGESVSLAIITFDSMPKYTGRVTAISGSGTTTGSSGFAYNWTATGICEITHNLGHTNYSVMLTPESTSDAIITINSHANNTFEIRGATSTSGTAQSRKFHFQVIPD